MPNEPAIATPRFEASAQRRASIHKAGHLVVASSLGLKKIEAVKLALAGKGLLIMAQQPEVDVWTGLLQALDLFAASQDTAGHV